MFPGSGKYPTSMENFNVVVQVDGQEWIVLTSRDHDFWGENMVDVIVDMSDVFIVIRVPDQSVIIIF